MVDTTRPARTSFLRRRPTADVPDQDDENIEDQIRNHELRTRQRREAFYSRFTVAIQKMLEETFYNWPTTSEGKPLPGMRAKFMKVLRLDHRNPASHAQCDMWMELVGWSIIGRNCWVDGRGTIWGPSPVDGVDEPFPYSRAVYDKVNDCWNLESDDPLYETFFGEAPDRQEAQ